MNLPLLTISRLKAARSCLRLHKLKYLDGYRPAHEPETTRFGTLVHKGLEAWWRAMAVRTSALEAALDAVRSAGEADPFELAKAEVLLIGYDTRWSDQTYEVLGVEVEFDGPLVSPLTGQESRTWRRAGKIDALVRERDTGRVLVVEHKTAGVDIRQGSEYWRRLRMDGQITSYFEGGRLLGHDIAGCLYDVVGKPGTKPAKATPMEARKYTKTTKAEPVSRLYAGQRDTDETPQEYRSRLAELIAEDLSGYFQRGEVARLEADMREGLLDDWHFAQTLRDSIRLERFPRNPGACIQYGRRCSYFDACTGMASLDDETRFTRDANVHPELALPDEREQPTQGVTP